MIKLEKLKILQVGNCPQKRIAYGVALLFIAFIASLPAFRSGVYFGHDIPFHLGRIQAIAEGLEAGQFPVRYEDNAWYGYGYVSSQFYGNIFLYIPALLFLAGLPLYRTYNIYLILVNIATAVVAFISFNGILKTRKWAFLAACIYCLSGYHLSNLYVRAAVGEYTAMIFVPLLIYAVYRLYNDEEKYKFKPVILIIIAATGLVQSHILTTEIMAALVVIYAIINFKTTNKLIRQLLASVAGILGINAFFLYPFIDGYTSMDLYINTDLSKTDISSEGLYFRQLFGLITTGVGYSTEWSTENEGYLNPGLLVVICFFAMLILIAKNKSWIKNDKERKVFHQALILFVFGLFAAFMSTVYFPWQLFAGDGIIASLMSSVQYPWRYLMIMMTSFTITGVYAIRIIAARISDGIRFKKASTKSASSICIDKAYILVAVVIVALSIGLTGVFDYVLSCRNITLTNITADDDWADKLYLPVGTNRDTLAESQDILVIEKEDGYYIDFPKLAYENVLVLDENGEVVKSWSGENNRVEIFAGDTDEKLSLIKENYTVTYQVPVSWHISELITIISVVIMILIGIYAFTKASRDF